MNAAAWTLLGIAAAFAIADWVAVTASVGAKPVEYLCKPATMVALGGVALAIDPERDAQRALFVVAVVLSLAGDVFLMLPRDLFVAGLASFLAAHGFYIAGFAISSLGAGGLTAGAVVVAVAASTIGGRILKAVRSGEHAKMLGPVALYMTAIGAMVVLAFGTGELLAIAGASLFFCSDSMIAWDRFVRPFRWARQAIMVTYHLAQAGLVLSLLR